jgi:hypothetical protein
VTDTTTGKEKEIGEAWDALDVPGKKALMDAGGEAIRLSAAEMAQVRKIGADLAQKNVKELDAKGLPASAAYGMMRSLSDKHSKTSKNFWN